MRTTYAPLFSIDIEHAYYRAGHPGADLEIRPTADTAQLMRNHAFVFRPSDRGCSVYAEIDSAVSAAPELVRPAGAGGLRFVFTIDAAAPYLASITDLPRARPGRQLWCFDNLRRDVAGADLFLGDAVAGARRGPPVWIEAAPELVHRVDPPVTGAQVTCRDRFGADVLDVAVQSPDPATAQSEYSIEGWDRLPPGRYTISDDAGGSRAVVKAPELRGRSPLGLIEIFDRTDGFASDGVDRVPPAYRFLNGDAVTARTYTLRLVPRPTTWRYVVVSKNRPLELDLTGLAIDGGPSFTRQVDGTRAVFTAQARRALSERPAALTLTGLNGSSMVLPSPGASTPLEAGTGPDDLISTLYVYV
ncbi:MAG: hypothetical protein QNJ12_06720 [Ilumatobacter sp.]|uniref:hypothetical protein n=1 Tax=Ilumatobacter sp. TaxID=1967498 RepID=UPI002632784B|nr:hypothetical protein [Ilumatobacter sp.]MDJ0768468.1 hypothetical protein [Ilumatobacter sp.]